MRDRMRFYLNGVAAEASGDDAFLTLAEYLRRRRGLTGTKIVCAEGDCGSCTVLVGRADVDGMRYSAITSCIALLFQFDAAHIVTVEGLRDRKDLNPIQQSMVACHGTQCGFCTPGFVVTLQQLMDDAKTLDANVIRRGLTGNLCRCTGYDSIIRAALSTDRSQLKSVDQLYPPGSMLTGLLEWAGQQVRIETPTHLFYKPITIEQAVRFRSENPACSVIAGGTDLGVVHNKKIRPITTALSLCGIGSLREVKTTPGTMQFGAGVSLSTFQSVAEEHLPELGQFMQWFGSPLIRSAGTIGGNLVTGSPIGDTIPALMVLDSEIEIAGCAGNRRVPISQFYTGYRKTVLAGDELVTSIKVPTLNDGRIFKLYKVSRRKDLDISSFSAAICMQASNGIIENIRIACGGVGPMVMRLAKTEAFLRGRATSLETFQQAGEIAQAEVTPIDDVRASAAYRRALAENIFCKFWHEVIGVNR